MPNSRRMPAVAAGVSELRVKGRTQFPRVLLDCFLSAASWYFHAFVKKIRRTPPLEIALGRKRLKELQ